LRCGIRTGRCFRVPALLLLGCGPLGLLTQQTHRSCRPEVYRQVIDLVRAGTRVKQPAATFRMSDVTICN
jgi:hypothetical protein